MPSRAYFDHAATSPLTDAARAVLLETLDLLGNASSVHAEGRRARAVMDDARSRVASALGVHDDEVIFTGSGTESDNLAIRGRIWAADDLPGGARPQLVTSAIEHQAVRRSARWLAARGDADHAVVAPGPDGLVRVDDILAALAPGRTSLVSVQAVNNELGTIQPADSLAEACRERGASFHSDAVQALGRIPVTRLARIADLVTFSAHKVGGPAGVGVLIVRRGLKLQPALTGGEQESGLRPGTENVALVAAAARAIADAVTLQPQRAAHLGGLSARLEAGLLGLPGARLNGDPERRAPGFTNISFDGADGGTLQQALDLAGFAASTGSACTSGSVAPSHVLAALDESPARAREALRFSFGPGNAAAEVDRLVAAFPDLLARARADTRGEG